MISQHTIARPVSLSGVGLHTGEFVSLTLHPAPANTGIVFLRNGGKACIASIQNVVSTELCTIIGTSVFQARTVEHILSALWGLEVDNIYLELDGDEVPAGDGSATPFVQLILNAGVISQNLPRTYLKILDPISVKAGNRTLTIEPAPATQITYLIDYPHPLIQQQRFVHRCAKQSFMRDVARARTFAFSHEVQSLWAKGFGKGGSLDNTVVFSDESVLNELGLRFPDECVRHKILDLIGDLALLGLPVIGHVIANRAGHSLHTLLVEKILEQPEAWTLLNGNKKEDLQPSEKFTPIHSVHSTHPHQPALF